MVDRPLTIRNIGTMRRLVPQLPTEQTLWVLDEAERLLRQRDELQAVLTQLEVPWRDVRAAMNQIAVALRSAP